MPVWILPGQPDDCVTLHMGYGGREVGRVGREAGFNVYPLRTSGRPWSRVVSLVKAVGNYNLASTQEHQLMHGRHPVEHGTLHELKEMLIACNCVIPYEDGYRRVEGYSPLPMEDLAEALGFRQTWLPLIVLIGGVLGGFALQYWVSWLRAAPIGHFFAVISNGKGPMPAHRTQIPPADRWAIAAYVRALQFSQHADASLLSAGDTSQLEASP